MFVRSLGVVGAFIIRHAVVRRFQLSGTQSINPISANYFYNFENL